MKRSISILVLLASLPCWAGRSFNGTSDNISAPGIGTPLDISSGPVTVSFWVYPTLVDASKHAMVAQWNGGNGSQMDIGLGVYGQSTTSMDYVFGCCGALGPSYTGCGTITSNKWYQVVVYVDSVGGSSGIIVSGGTSCSAFIAFSNDRTAGGANFTIGTDNGQSYFEGIIAEVAVWNVLLTPAEKMALQTVCPASVRRTSLVGYFPLWGASGSSREPDLSGNQLNGTLTGTAGTNHAPCKP
jgi:hypothetical protein